MSKTFIHTNGLGVQKKITELTVSQLKKETKKLKAKFIRDAKRLKATCDELNRRKLVSKKGNKIVYYPTKILDASIGRVFGFETDDEHNRMSAIYQLVFNILSKEDFGEEDKAIALQVLQQGMSRIDD